MIRAAPVCLFLLAAVAGATAEAALSPPEGAALAVSTTEAPASHRVATGPFRGTLPATVAEGAVTRRVWRAPGVPTTLALLAPLRAQLVAEGWEIVFECMTRDCGGFDFRFEIDVTPAPDMFVDLADFRYLSARRGDAWTTLVVSLSAGTGYVQAIEVDPDGAAAPAGPDPAPPQGQAPVETAPPPPPSVGVAADPGTDTDIARSLQATGHAVLSDLDFGSGTTDLPADAFPSLDALAAYMRADPALMVALVGHTDATGSAAGNLAISRRRAESARRLLVSRYGIAAARVDAQGVGFYAPVASNATEEGRRANRRVEAVITRAE